LLVDAGANTDSINSELKDYTALHIAVSTKKPNLDLVRVLLTNCDPNLKNVNGATALHLSAMWGHDDVVALLIDAGAKLKTKNTKGRTALEVAVRNGHDNIGKMLAKQMGVDIPKLKQKKTLIGTIEAPDAPPPPPDDEDN